MRDDSRTTLEQKTPESKMSDAGNPCRCQLDICFHSRMVLVVIYGMGRVGETVYPARRRRPPGGGRPARRSRRGGGSSASAEGSGTRRGPVASPLVRVLITGATGFAGRHLCSHCLGLGHEVHALVRPGREEAVPPGVTAHPAELADPASVAAALRAAAPERLFHLAGARRSGAPSPSRWRPGTSTSAAPSPCSRPCAPRRREVAALVVTSGEVYGAVPLDALPVGAETPLNPVSPYGASKAAADLATAQYRAAYGLPAFRVRAFNQIGPGQDARFVLPNVARQIARAERDGAAGGGGARGEPGHPPRLHRRARHGARLLAASWSAAIPTPSTSPAAAPPRRCGRSSSGSAPSRASP